MPTDTMTANGVGAGATERPWRLVPAEPTEEMHHAARDWSAKKYGKPIGLDASLGCYHAMLAAAPEPPNSYHPERDALLVEVKAGQQHALERLRVRLEIRLNDHLCEMKPDYDDSITGFNEACVIMNKLFSDEIDRLRATQAKAGT